MLLQPCSKHEAKIHGATLGSVDNDPAVVRSQVFVFRLRCLAGLSYAIKRPDDTTFHCFRAIESLRQSFGSELFETEQ